MNILRSQFEGDDAVSKLKMDRRMSFYIRFGVDILQKYTSITFDSFVPYWVLNNAKGIVFLKNYRIGCLGGIETGTGIVLLRLGKEKWSPPLMIHSYKISLGMQGGITQANHILILNNVAACKMFLDQGRKFSLGADVSIAAGPVGREMNLGTMIKLTEAPANIYSYCNTTSGLWIGAALSGQIITTSKTGNNRFYMFNSNITNRDVLLGKVIMPNCVPYDKLVDMLDLYCRRVQNIVKTIEDQSNLSLDPPVEDVDGSKYNYISLDQEKFEKFTLETPSGSSQELDTQLFPKAPVFVKKYEFKRKVDLHYIPEKSKNENLKKMKIQIICKLLHNS